jgi:Zn finger protein HypA/HybF involved in hydrogenase expression
MMLKFDSADIEIVERVPVAKHRRCLMCGTDFKSAHVGERICPKCRQSKAWRDGDTPSYGGGRR